MMNLRVLKQDEHYIKLEIEDDPYTLYSLLKHVLSQRKDVKMAGYAKTETFKDKIIFQLETTDDCKYTPIQVLKQASEEIMNLTDQFWDAMVDALS